MFPLLSFAQVDDAALSTPERVVWNKAPIAIPLVVGEERLVHFPDSVSIGLPQSLTPLLRSQSINGTPICWPGKPLNPPCHGALGNRRPDLRPRYLSGTRRSRQSIIAGCAGTAQSPKPRCRCRSVNIGQAITAFGLCRFNPVCRATTLCANTTDPRQPGVVAIPVNPNRSIW